MTIDHEQMNVVGLWTFTKQQNMKEPKGKWKICSNRQKETTRRIQMYTHGSYENQLFFSSHIFEICRRSKEEKKGSETKKRQNEKYEKQFSENLVRIKVILFANNWIYPVQYIIFGLFYRYDNASFAEKCKTERERKNTKKLMLKIIELSKVWKRMKDKIFDDCTAREWKNIKNYNLYDCIHMSVWTDI